MTTDSKHDAMPTTRDALLARWNDTVRRCQTGAAADPAPSGHDLLERWSEPHRHYHTVDHLLAVLDHVDALADQAVDADAVRLATWYHDAIYVPASPDNEEDSALLAEAGLAELGLDTVRIAEVARLVRLTAHHAPDPGDVNGEVLCDADLAILGTTADRYATYCAAVRKEYAFAPDDMFRVGRVAVLHQLLDVPQLFHTLRGSERWEAAARRHLMAELEGSPGRDS